MGVELRLAGGEGLKPELNFRMTQWEVDINRLSWNLKKA